MRTITLLILSCASALGHEVRLAWDPSPTEGVTNYMVCATTNSAPITLSNALVRVSFGTNLTASLTNLAAAKWQFMAVAQKDGLTSDPSNVLYLEIPEPPAAMRVVVPQWSASVAGTNWQDLGFFRIRFETK